MLSIDKTNETVLNKEFYSTKKKLVLKNNIETVAKIALVACFVFGGAFIGTTIATNFAFNVLFCMDIGSVVGLIIGVSALILNTNRQRQNIKVIAQNIENDLKKSPDPSFESFDKQLKDEFIKNNEKQIEEVMDSIHTFHDLETPISDEALDKLIEIVGETKTMITAHFRYKQLYQALSAKFNKEQLFEIYKNPKILPARLIRKDKILTNKAIAFIVNRAENYYTNLKTIETLHQQIEKEVLDQVLTRLEINDLYGCRIDKAIQQNIIYLASTYKKEANVDELFEKIKVAVNRDLYLDENYIEDFFQIKEKMQDLPPHIQKEKRDKLRVIINSAYVNRELRNKGKITTGSRSEVAILKSLGFLVQGSTYFDKDSLYAVFKTILASQLEEQKCHIPLKFLKETINDCALRNRLRAANMTEELQITKFQIIQEFYKEIKKETYESLKNYRLNFPAKFPLPENSPNVRSLTEDLIFGQKNAIKRFLLNSGLQTQKHKEAFLDLNFNIQDYKDLLFIKLKNYLKIQLPDKISKVQEHTCFKANIEFLAKWGSYIKAEMIQGLDDENEVLIKGACWGISQRLRLNAHRLNISLEDFIKEIQIQPLDRYLQATHSCSVKQAHTLDLPQIILKKGNCEREEKIFTIIGSDKSETSQKMIKKQLLENLQRAALVIHQANGWATFDLSMKGSGHETLLHIQKEDPHKVWFFDPNIGLLSFEQNQTFAKSLELCADFINDLIEIYYPDIRQVTASGLVL